MHLASATIVVSDQEKALDFFVNKLGWEKAYDQDVAGEFRFITVVPPGAQTQLVLGLAGWLGEGKNPGGPTGINIETSDIDAAYKELSERGVKFKGPVETMPWGAKATWFYDPDDNEFYLIEG